MLDDLDSKMESKLEKKLYPKLKRKNLSDGFKDDKVVNEVLDKLTVMTLYEMIKSHLISYINGVVKAGKESVVFWAVDENKNNVALKVYLVTTSNFKKRLSYIIGDPRFSRIKKGTRNLVNLWAQKEFTNLKQCFDCGIPVVKPLFVKKNIMAMEFMGQNGILEKTLVESEITQEDYDSTISILDQLYNNAKLIHGDFSEFNIFKTKKGLVLFDLGSAVDLKHPMADEFLERDINNITNFFARRGLTVKNPSDILVMIKK